MVVAPHIRTVQGGKQFTRAQFVPATLNEEARTIDVVATTERPVTMYEWWGEPFREILSLEDGHLDTTRLDSGVPFLNNHNRYDGVFGVYGVVDAWRIEDGQLIATVRFDDDEKSDSVYRKIKNGIVKGISIGYNVYEYEEVRTGESQTPTFRAISWEVTEVSAAPIQADTSSVVRSEAEDKHEIKVRQAATTSGAPKQSKQTKPDTMKREQLVELLKKRGIAFDDNATDAELMTALERALEAAPKPTTDPQGQADDSAVRAAITAERDRVASIRKAVTAAKLGEEFANTHIDKGTSIEEVRALVIEEFAKQDPNAGSRGQIGVGKDTRAMKREAITEAIEHRLGLVTDFKKGGRDFRGLSLRDIAAECLRDAGLNPADYQGKERLFKAAMGRLQGLHTTSDFPLILADTMNKTLRQAYSDAPRTFTEWARREVAGDFREMSRTQISGLVGDLEEVQEGGEYKHDTMTESAEKYKVKKYGKIISLSYEAMMNDDLSAFNRTARAVANAATQLQSDLVYAILTGNPTMADGENLFSVPHANIASSASVIDIANMGIAVAAMRKQKGLDGKFINVAPAYLIVGPDREVQARQLVNSTIVPNTVNNANIFSGAVQVIVDPRITDNKWFLAANPNQIDTVEYAFLDGEELYTEEKEGFDVDGVQLKARMVFGTKAIDHRGLFYNAGA
jgi:HK97 family phage prohead protease